MGTCIHVLNHGWPIGIRTSPEALISMVHPGGRGQIQSTDPPSQPPRLSAYDHETASVVVSYNTT